MAERRTSSHTLSALGLRLGLCEAALLLSGFLAGVAGYYLDNPAPPWGDEQSFRVDALHNAAELLLAGSLSPLGQLSWPARYCALALPGAFLLFALTAVWFFAANPLRRMLIVRRGGHLLLCGPPDAARLVFSWRRPTIWVLPEPLGLGERAALPRHAARVRGELSAPRVRQRAGAWQAADVVLFADDGAHNGRTAALLLEALAAGPGAPGGCALHVCFQTAHLAEEYERRLAPLPLPPGVELNLFHPQAVGVRRLLLESPTERFRFGTGPSETRLVVIGLGSWGSEVLKRLLLECHPVAPGRAAIEVVDRDAGHLSQLFADNHPDGFAFPPITWTPLDVANERAFGGWLDRELLAAPPPCAYFVCLGGGERSYSTALRLESALRERLAQGVPIYYHCFAAAPALPAGCSTLHPFGSREETLAEELVLQSQRDLVARQIHEGYLKSSLAAGARLGERPALVEWSRLPLTFKKENRSQADHHLFKIRQAGCRVRPAGNPRLHRFDPGQLELLAEAEHQRWCASRLMSGWRHGSPRDDARKIHPDIVPYPLLSERVKDLDRDAVANLPALFAALGMEVVPDLLLGVGEWGDEAGEDEARSGGRALAAAREAFPERAPVLVLQLKSARERALGLGWLEAGGVVWLLLDEPVYLLRERLGDAERDCLDRLVLGAERSLARAAGGADASPVTHHIVADRDGVRICADRERGIKQ